MSATSHAVEAAPSQHAHGHPRPKTNTGFSNGIIGIMCFLVSEMALFGSLIFGYLYVRRASPHWPPYIPGTSTQFDSFEWQLPTINTVVLLSSGVTMHFAYHAFRRGKLDRMIQLLVLTIVLGAGFVSGQVYEYIHVKQHLAFNTSSYGATFFMLTGLHGFHVTLGVIFLITALVATLKGKISPPASMPLHAVTLYWHFVDAVWVVLFALFYLTV